MSEVYHSAIAKLLLPFGRFFGAVVPYRGSNIPTEVRNNSSLLNGKLYWNRVFKFPNNRVFHLKSYMEAGRQKEVIEFVRFGVGMRLKLSVEDGALVFRGNGYVWRLFGRNMPIPAGIFFGTVYVAERPLDDGVFTMEMTLIHGLFGPLFRFHGRFTLD